MSFWPNTLVDWLQIASAIGTCGAVIVSLVLANRGIQTKVEAKCRVVDGIGAPQLKVEFRNVGRDTVYLITLGGTDKKGLERRHILPPFDKAMQLPPGAPEYIDLEKHRDTVTEYAHGSKPFIRLWLEDASGKRFYVKNSAECLEKIWSE